MAGGKIGEVGDWERERLITSKSSLKGLYSLESREETTSQDEADILEVCSRAMRCSGKCFLQCMY